MNTIKFALLMIAVLMLAHACGTVAYGQQTGLALPVSTISPPIIVLFFISGPTNISRFVVPVIINSIQGVTRRGFASKMVQKFFVALKSKLYPSPAVAIPSVIVGIITPILSRCVGGIFGASSTRNDARFIVLRKHLKALFSFYTATGFRMAARQVAGRHDRETFASAQTEPSSLGVCTPIDTDYGQTTKLFTSQIGSIVGLWCEGLKRDFVNGLKHRRFYHEYA